jgi:hypothetical protein
MRFTQAIGKTPFLWTPIGNSLAHLWSRNGDGAHDHARHVYPQIAAGRVEFVQKASLI